MFNMNSSCVVVVVVAYTCTFLNSSFAEGVWGLRTTLTAIAAATAKATEVKKPKTFWTRTRVECMLGVDSSAVWSCVVVVVSEGEVFNRG